MNFVYIFLGVGVFSNKRKFGYTQVFLKTNCEAHIYLDFDGSRADGKNAAYEVKTSHPVSCNT